MLKVKVDQVAPAGTPLQLTKTVQQDDDDPISIGRYSDFSTSDTAPSEESDSAVAESGESGTSICEAPPALLPVNQAEAVRENSSILLCVPEMDEHPSMGDENPTTTSIQMLDDNIQDISGDDKLLSIEQRAVLSYQLAGPPAVSFSDSAADSSMNSEDDVHLQLELDTSDIEDPGHHAADNAGPGRENHKVKESTNIAMERCVNTELETSAPNPPPGDTGMDSSVTEPLPELQPPAKPESSVGIFLEPSRVVDSAPKESHVVASSAREMESEQTDRENSPGNVNPEVGKAAADCVQVQENPGNIGESVEHVEPSEVQVRPGTDSKPESVCEPSTVESSEATPPVSLGQESMEVSSAEAGNVLPAELSGVLPVETEHEGVQTTNAEHAPAVDMEQGDPTHIEHVAPVDTKQATSANTEHVTSTDTEPVPPVVNEHVKATDTEHAQPVDTEHVTPADPKNITMGDNEHVPVKDIENISLADNELVESTDTKHGTLAGDGENVPATDTEPVSLVDTEQAPTQDMQHVSPVAHEQFPPAGIGHPPDAQHVPPASIELFPAADMEKVPPAETERATPAEKPLVLPETMEHVPEEIEPITSMEMEQAPPANAEQVSPAADMEHVSPVAVEHLSLAETELATVADKELVPADMERVTSLEMEQASAAEQFHPADIEQATSVGMEHVPISEMEQAALTDTKQFPPANEVAVPPAHQENVSPVAIAQVPPADTEHTTSAEMEQVTPADVPATDVEQHSAAITENLPAAEIEQVPSAVLEPVPPVFAESVPPANMEHFPTDMEHVPETITETKPAAITENAPPAEAEHVAPVGVEYVPSADTDPASAEQVAAVAIPTTSSETEHFVTEIAATAGTAEIANIEHGDHAHVDPVHVEQAAAADMGEVFPPGIGEESLEPASIEHPIPAVLEHVDHVSPEHVAMESTDDVGTVAYVVEEPGPDGEPGSQYYILEGDVAGLAGEGDNENPEGGQVLLINVSGEEELENSESYMEQMDQVNMAEALETSSPTEQVFETSDTLEDMQEVHSHDVVQEVVEVEVPYTRGHDLGDMSSLDYAMQHGLGADGHYLDDIASEPSDLPDSLTNAVLDKYTTASKESVVVEKIATQYVIPVIKNEEEEPIVDFAEQTSTQQAEADASAAAAKADPLTQQQQALSAQTQPFGITNPVKKRRKRDPNKPRGRSQKVKNKDPLRDVRLPQQIPQVPMLPENLILPEMVGKIPLTPIDAEDKVGEAPKVPLHTPSTSTGTKPKRRRRRKLSPVQKQHPTIATMLNQAPLYPPTFLLLPRPTGVDAEKLAEEALAGMGDIMSPPTSTAVVTSADDFYNLGVLAESGALSAAALASSTALNTHSSTMTFAHPPKTGATTTDVLSPPVQAPPPPPPFPTSHSVHIPPTLPSTLTNSAQYPLTANAITQALKQPTEVTLPTLPGGLGQPGTPSNPTYSQITAPPKKRARSFEYDALTQPLPAPHKSSNKPGKSSKRHERLPSASSIATMVEGMISDVFVESLTENNKPAVASAVPPGPHHILKVPSTQSRHASYPPVAGTSQPQFVSPLQSPDSLAISQALDQLPYTSGEPLTSPTSSIHAMVRNLLSADVDLNDDNLADHYIKNWRPTGRFQCHFCPYSSVTKNYLFRHWLVNHNTMEAYKCGYCDKRATYRDSITRHQSINHKNMDKWVLIDAIIQERTFLTFQAIFGIQVSINEKTHGASLVMDHADDETIQLGQEAVQRQQNATDGIKRKSASIIYERTFDDTSKGVVPDPVMVPMSKPEEHRVNHVGALPPQATQPQMLPPLSEAMAALALPVPVGSGSTTVRSHSMTLPVRNPSKLLREVALPQNPEDRSIIETAHYAISNVPMLRKSNSTDTNGAAAGNAVEYTIRNDPYTVKNEPGGAPYSGTEQEQALNLSNKVPPPYPGYPVPGGRLPLSMPLPLPPHLQLQPGMPMLGPMPPGHRIQGPTNKMFIMEQTTPTEIVIDQKIPVQSVSSIKEALLKPPRQFAPNPKYMPVSSMETLTHAGLLPPPQPVAAISAPPRVAAAPIRVAAPQLRVAAPPPQVIAMPRVATSVPLTGAQYRVPAPAQHRVAVPVLPPPQTAAAFSQIPPPPRTATVASPVSAAELSASVVAAALQASPPSPRVPMPHTTMVPPVLFAAPRTVAMPPAVAPLRAAAAALPTAVPPRAAAPPTSALPVVALAAPPMQQFPWTATATSMGAPPPHQPWLLSPDRTMFPVPVMDTSTSQDFSAASAASVLKSLSELSSKTTVSIADNVHRRPPGPPPPPLPDPAQLALMYGLKIPETALSQASMLGPMLSPQFRPDFGVTAPNLALFSSALNTTPVSVPRTASSSSSGSSTTATPSSTSVRLQ